MNRKVSLANAPFAEETFRFNSSRMENTSAAIIFIVFQSANPTDIVRIFTQNQTIRIRPNIGNVISVIIIRNNNYGNISHRQEQTGTNF